MCEGSDVRALAGLMVAPQPGSTTCMPGAATAPSAAVAAGVAAVRAAGCLCALVDTCGGADFKEVICRGGARAPLAAAASWLGLGLGLGLAPSRPGDQPAAHGSSGSSACVEETPCPAWLAAAAPGIAAEARRCALRLLLGCQDRARRMASGSASAAAAGAQRTQPPPALRWGFWSSLSRADLVRLEALRQLPAAAGGGSRPDAHIAAPSPPPPPPAAAGGVSLVSAGGRPARAPQQPRLPASGHEGNSGCGKGAGAGGGEGEGYDEDGLRTVYSSGPTAAVAAARASWTAVPLRQRVTWSQTSTDVTITIKLPPGQGNLLGRGHAVLQCTKA